MGEVVSFPPFELDRRSGELRKHGVKIRLADQPLQILLLLLDRPGDVITRDEIQQRLWSSDTFVDFDAGLSSAVRKLRDALGDSADRPRFVETVPKRGYRFIAPVAMPIATAAPASRLRYFPAAALFLAITAGILFLYGARRGPAAPAVRGESASQSQPPQVNPRAYDAYQKGLSAQGQGTVAGFRTAMAYFEEAIAQQPEFAAAHAQLANTELQFLYGGPLPPRAFIPKAETAARRAVQLDETQPLGHRVLGTILHTYYWRWDEGDRELQRALDLDPNAVEALSQRTFGLIRQGRFEEAIAQTERLRQRDPHNVAAAINLGSALRAAGHHDAAIAEYQRALEIDPDNPRPHLQIGITLGFMNKWPEAVHELQTAVKARPDNLRFLAYLGYATARAGHVAEARRILATLETRASHQYVSSFGIALLHDALGEKELAIAALQRAYDEHAIEFAQPGQYPDFQTAMHDPRYEAVMRRVRRPD